eukprot:SAG31_NODE_1135_length_9735_cov_4.098900_3_plen_616_part_00
MLQSSMDGHSSPVFEDNSPHREQTSGSDGDEHSSALVKPGEVVLKAGPWSEEDRAKLRQAVTTHKSDWGAVASSVGRTKASCRRRWQEHEVKLLESENRSNNLKFQSRGSQVPANNDGSSMMVEDADGVTQACRNLLKTSLLARRIPEENSVAQVLSWFQRFGSVSSVTIDSSAKDMYALITFATVEDCRAAKIGHFDAAKKACQTAPVAAQPNRSDVHKEKKASVSHPGAAAAGTGEAAAAAVDVRAQNGDTTEISTDTEHPDASQSLQDALCTKEEDSHPGAAAPSASASAGKVPVASSDLQLSGNSPAQSNETQFNVAQIIRKAELHMRLCGIPVPHTAGSHSDSEACTETEVAKPWSDHETARLVEAAVKFNCQQWNEIAKVTDKRSETACRLHYNTICVLEPDKIEMARLMQLDPEKNDENKTSSEQRHNSKKRSKATATVDRAKRQRTKSARKVSQGRKIVPHSKRNAGTKTSKGAASKTVLSTKCKTNSASPIKMRSSRSGRCIKTKRPREPPGANGEAQLKVHDRTVPTLEAIAAPDPTSSADLEPVSGNRWTMEERLALHDAVLLYDNDWGAAAELVGRSRASCRRRWQDHECHLPLSGLTMLKPA